MQFFDKLEAVFDAKVKPTKEGFIVGMARAARTGIQSYRGSELNKPELGQVRLYRPEEEVFSRDTMASFANRTMTNNHPPVMVDSKNWKEFSVGHTGDEIVRDGTFVKLPLILMDGAVIDAYKAGKKELSAGYECVIDWTPGTAPDGSEYDAVQRNIRVNHLAVVDAGRAGSECRLGDQTASDDKGADHMADKALRTVMFDGMSIEITDQGAQALAKLQSMLQDALDANENLTDQHAAAIAAKDAELGKQTAEIEKLKASQVSDAQLDALTAVRGEVIAKAKMLDASFDPKGKSNAEIRRAVVTTKLGDAKTKDRSDEYIEATFDALTVDFKPGDVSLRRDPIRDGLMNGNGHSNQTLVDAAHAEYVKDLQNAYKNEKGAA